ncbi:MAG: hypothetical protein EZS28_031069, partial [Streblomastix strix]
MRFMELLTGLNAFAIDFWRESNRIGADTGLQGANFVYSRVSKTRRSTVAPSFEQRREQPSGWIHSEFVVQNPDAAQAYNTLDSICTRRKHERDIDRPSKHVCGTITLRRKVNLQPNTDDGRRLRGLII